MEVITTHIHADFDSLASMIAAKKLYPQAVLVFPGSQEKNLREFFLQSTAYAFEFVRARDLDINQVTRLILVDIRQKSRIGIFSSLADKNGVEIHIYDHHPASADDLKGSLEFIRPAGANITNLVEVLKCCQLPLSPTEATIMMLGIYEDTGSLTFASATENDFLAAAYLLSQGANLQVVSEMITRELTVEQISLLNELIEEATEYQIGGVPVTISIASLNNYMGDLALLVHKLMEMQNLSVIFALVRMEDRVYVVARSRISEVNVGEVVSLLGGGGHPTAAAATIKDLTPAQAREKVLAILKEHVRPSATAGELMTAPVKTVPPTASLEEVSNELTKYNINVLPVELNGVVVGLITRQIVGKAIFHGLKALPVQEYMISDFAVVNVDTPVGEVKKAIMEGKQRLLPVLHQGRLAGCITRTDLLQHIYEEDRAAMPEEVSLPPRARKMAKVMQERLPSRWLKLLQDLGRTGDQLHMNVYAVGGFVRDLLLGVKNWDIDIVVEGDGIKFASEFARKKEGRVRSHKAFGTAAITFPGGWKVDIATARLEYYPHPGALPTVESGSIKLDLYRRDFTINTLALCLNTERFGELLDFFSARRDLKDHVIRVLHNLSFVEDPTRILRAFRFAHRLHFQISKHTHKLIKNAVQLELFRDVEGQRLILELKAILAEDDPLPILEQMETLGIHAAIHPRLKFTPEQARLFRQIARVLSWYSLLYIEKKPEVWLVYLLAYTQKIPAKELFSLTTRFNLSEPARKSLEKSREVFFRLSRSLEAADARGSEIYHFLSDIPLEALLFLMARTEKEPVKKAISLYLTKLQSVATYTRGQDLKKMGFTPGPLFNEILQNLFDARLDGKVSTREEEKEYILRHYGNPKEKSES